MGIEHDAQRAECFHARQPHGQKRIVGERRAGADQDRIMERALHLDNGIRFFAGNEKPRRAGSAGGKTIGGLGEFQRDHRPVFRRLQNMAEIEPISGLRKHAGADLDPGIAQSRVAAPAHAWVRIIKSGYDARDAAGNDRVGARRRAAMMAAGLERHIKRRASGWRPLPAPMRSLRHAAARHRRSSRAR